MMKLTAIAIISSNGVLGDGVDQPFKFREDWARFKRLTMGHPLIVGRKTYEIIGSLPGRPSIVLTRTAEGISIPHDERGDHGRIVGSVAEAIEAARQWSDHAYVIGGGEIYRLMWEELDFLEITEVHSEAVGEVTFPAISADEWEEINRICKEEFDFVTYRRVNSSAR